MRTALIVAAVVWPALLGAAAWQRTTGASQVWTATVYLAAARLCHQRPDRSFHTAGVKWPVCARCAGLYLGGAVGAMAFALSARRRSRLGRRGVSWLLLAAVPTVLTLLVEWAGLPVGNGVRAVAALPLGAVIAALVVDAAPERLRAIR